MGAEIFSERADSRLRGFKVFFCPQGHKLVLTQRAEIDQRFLDIIGGITELFRPGFSKT